MANFYTEVPELKYHLNNSMMERICELKERGYQDKDKYDYAPQDYADAMDSFDRYLKSPERLPERLSLPMPRAWTKKVPTVPTAVWNMPAAPSRTSTPW